MDRPSQRRGREDKNRNTTTVKSIVKLPGFKPPPQPPIRTQQALRTWPEQNRPPSPEKRLETSGGKQFSSSASSASGHVPALQPKSGKCLNMIAGNSRRDTLVPNMEPRLSSHAVPVSAHQTFAADQLCIKTDEPPECWDGFCENKLTFQGDAVLESPSSCSGNNSC